MTEQIDYRAREMEWVAALRSGKHIQVKGVLGEAYHEDIPRNCCLGVACEVAGIVPTTTFGSVSDQYDEGSLEYDGAITSLPERAREWLGVTMADPWIDFPDGLLTRDRRGSLELTCTMLNDDLRLTFDQIADLVEYFGLVR